MQRSGQFFDGNRVTLLESGAEYFPALIAAIDGAQREIFIETYIFEPDETGHAVANALGQAAERGVTVRVLVDGFGGRSFVRTLMNPLIARGVHVLIYRRELQRLSLRRSRLRRLHRKLAVIDGRTAFVGGINIIDDLTEVGSPHPRFDYAVQVEGPVLAAILESTDHLWRLVSWASLRRRKRLPIAAQAVTTPVGSTRAAFLIRDSLYHRHDIENAYLQALAEAREEMVIACAYFFPGKRFRQALLDAARRGVSITLLLPGPSDHPLQKLASRALYPLLLEHGIRLFEYQRSHLHAKVAVADQHWATVGSSNIDPFSLLLAREANLVIEDRAFAHALRSSLAQAMAEGATELRPQDWHTLPRLARAASWLAFALLRLLVGLAGYRGQH